MRGKVGKTRTEKTIRRIRIPGNKSGCNETGKLEEMRFEQRHKGVTQEIWGRDSQEGEEPVQVAQGNTGLARRS